MPRLKWLTSREVLRILGDSGFEVVSMRGSHAKLVRITATGERQVLTVPMHSQLAIGTVHAIYRQAARFVPIAELRSEFFSD